LPEGPEAVEHAQRVELAEASRRDPRAGEVQSAQLLGREDAMLEAVLGDLAVAVGQLRCQASRIASPNRRLPISSYLRRYHYLPLCRIFWKLRDRRQRGDSTASG